MKNLIFLSIMLFCSTAFKCQLTETEKKDNELTKQLDAMTNEQVTSVNKPNYDYLFTRLKNTKSGEEIQFGSMSFDCTQSKEWPGEEYILKNDSYDLIVWTPKGWNDDMTIKKVVHKS
jgi:hypothetical protein